MPQGNGVSAQPQAPHPVRSRAVWLTAIGVSVIAAALFAGVELARSNSDIICTRSFQDSGACTDGAWGPWTIGNQSSDTASCSTTYNETRTYTGLRNTISTSISAGANRHLHCNLNDSYFVNGSGTITSQYSACQIQESRTRVASGTGSGASCQVPSSSTQGTITSDTNTETNGTIDESKTQAVTGSYQMYLDMIDARLATTTFRAMPSLVRGGSTTHIVWTSSHVKSCIVTSTNTDTWPKAVAGTKVVTDADGNQTTVPTSTMPTGLSGDEVTSPITQQTTYTLTCMTATGKALVSHATVNLIPVFKEN